MFKEKHNNKELFLAFVSPLSTEEALDYIKSILKKYDQDFDLVWCRFFLSPDISHDDFLKHPFTAQLNRKSRASIVIQKPEQGSFSALFYFIKKGLYTFRQFDIGYELRGKDYHFLYLNNLQSQKADIKEATNEILKQMDELAHEQGYVPREHLLRTWLFLPDLLNDYTGMVEERNRYFEMIERTEDVGFPASTGIEGKPLSSSPLSLDAFFIKKIKKEQRKELHAPGFMPTAFSYGVAFARGWKITYGDREHFYLSGTASINDAGDIIHTDDIKTQCERALANFEQLLVQERATLNDLSYVIAYVKDEKDMDLCSKFYQEHLPKNLPLIVVRASVCRPGWLIEIEGIASQASKSCFPDL